MKRFKVLAIIAAALFALGTVQSCEKHAYSISTNIFRVKDGSHVNDVKNSMNIDRGSTVYVFATYSDKARIMEGSYSVTSTEEEVVKTSIGEIEGAPCIVLQGVKKGSCDVTLNFLHDGFKLYKTVSVSVK